MKIRTYGPHQEITFNYIAPKQTHSSNLIEIIHGQENLQNCDGIWSRNSQFCLGVRTADCAPISFFNDEIFGIIHAGWRGCINGIVEEMIKITEVQSPKQKTHFQVGPILPKFEIQKDDCYQQLFQKFGNQFFYSKNDKIIFNFKDCLQFLLPTATFDARSTLKDSSLASWRGNQNSDRNITVISTSKDSLSL